MTDDVAGVVADFNYRLVERAVDHLRQHAENRRPAIGKIREYCEAHRPQRSRTQDEVEHEAYLRDIQLHPEKYTPVNLVLEAAMEVRDQRAKEGFGEAEAKRRIESLVEERRMEWLAGLKKRGVLDRKTVAAGA